MTFLMFALCLNGCVMRNGQIEAVSFGKSAIKNMEDVEKQRQRLKNGKRASIGAVLAISQLTDGRRKRLDQALGK